MPQKIVKESPSSCATEEPEEISNQHWITPDQARKHNEQIPLVDSKSTLRLATFNLNRHRDFLDEPGLEEMMMSIEKINATVICLQEVFLQEKHDLIERLSPLGYVKLYWDMNERYKEKSSGNLIAVKAPHNEIYFNFIQTLKEYNIAAADVTCNGWKIAVINVKLHKNNASERQEQVAKILKFLDRKAMPFYRFYVITGDFGEDSDGESTNMLRERDRVREIFSALEWPKPISTRASGLCLGHILVSPRLARCAKGAYLYYSVNSVHLAVLADFFIKDKHLWKPRKKIGDYVNKPTFIY